MSEPTHQRLENLAIGAYSELRSVASAVKRSSRARLDTTSLLHGALSRLFKGETRGFQGEAHFLRSAARTMRHLIIDLARKEDRQKRHRKIYMATLSNKSESLDRNELLDLDAALDKLRVEDHRKAQIVELRFYAGCTLEQIARTLGLTTTRVHRELEFSRAWLYREVAR